MAFFCPHSFRRIVWSQMLALHWVPLAKHMITNATYSRPFGSSRSSGINPVARSADIRQSRLTITGVYYERVSTYQPKLGGPHSTSVHLYDVVRFPCLVEEASV